MYFLLSFSFLPVPSRQVVLWLVTGCWGCSLEILGIQENTRRRTTFLIWPGTPPHSSHPMKYERIYVKGDPVAATSTTRAALKQQLYQDVYHVMYLQLFRIELLLYRYATMNSTFFCHVPVIHNSDKMSSNWSVTISFECKCKLPSFII